MLHINSLQLDVHHDEIDLKKKTAKIIGCNINEIKNIEILFLLFLLILNYFIWVRKNQSKELSDL